ncbi:helix-turn-helix domain-containing protein [Streptomyces fungicidicus]|uniref:helix-turn-helix domain-containing protein n=1 Tax=Streptomyces fungicidicus TaxID=68203 RepID=UPI0033DECC5B
MKDAPTADINEWGTLVCLAEAADEDGCNAFPSVKTMAAYAKISTRTVQRALAAMEERKLIAEGDQRAAHYIPVHRRPTVHDLLIPYDWFRDIERTNAFRMRLGRPPLTRTDRPPIAPAPPKKTRADKGRPKPKETSQDAGPEGEPEGRLEVTRVENPAQGATTSQGVTTSPKRGDYKFKGGRLEVTQPTPKTRTTDSPLPSVGSSGSAPAAKDGGKDGSALDSRTPMQVRTVERTPGVDLLLVVGNQRPELLLTGKVLADQGRAVDGLLLADWPRDLILSALLRPLPADTRSVSAVLAKRLSDLLMTPLPRSMSMPAPRRPESADGCWDRYEDAERASVWQSDLMAAGADVHSMVRRRTRFADCADCRDPIVTPTGTGLCVKCVGWPQCPVCKKYVQPNTACEACEVRPDEVDFEQCKEHGVQFIRGTACFECVGPKA